MVLEDGRITAVGTSVTEPAGAAVIDGSGLHVYQGLFDAGTQLGLTEIGAVDATSDYSELGSYTPHLQSRTAVHPASEHIPVARSNGITHTLALPGGGGGWFGGGGGGSRGVVPGQGSTIGLAGWTIEEMDIETGHGHLVIHGVEVSTTDRHRELYEPYRSRPLPRGIERSPRSARGTLPASRGPGHVLRFRARDAHPDSDSHPDSDLDSHGGLHGGY